MKFAAILVATLGLSACSMGVTAMPDGGIAGYDAIKAAQAKCEAKGKNLRLKRNGNPQYLDDYSCVKD